MTTYPTLSDDALTAEKRRLSQKAADLARDLNAVNRELDEIRREDHRRFCNRLVQFTKQPT
jgi:hypothetical protein